MSDAPSPETDLQTAGARLRQAREQKGLSLEEAARVTRIAKGYLKALEDDCLDRLPNEAYARGFLRVYARYLDLQAEEIMGSFTGGVHDGVQPNGDTEAATDGETSVGRPRSAKRWLLVFLPFFLLCAILLATCLFKRENGVPVPVVSPDNHPVADTSVSPPPSQPGQAENKPAAEQSDTRDEIPFETPASSGKGIILRLKAIEDGALDITIDNMISQHYDLKAGDIIEWKGEKVFSLDLQNAGGVEAELNGRILAPFGEKGVQTHVRLDPGADDGKTAP